VTFSANGRSTLELDFADATEKVSDGDSGHSQVAITDACRVPPERLHPKAAYLRCRPTANLRVPLDSPAERSFSPAGSGTAALSLYSSRHDHAVRCARCGHGDPGSVC
jgi:hypothetical protein